MYWNVTDLGNKNFRGIIGNNTLKNMNAILHLGKGILEVNGKQIPFTYSCPLEYVNYIEPIEHCEFNLSHLNLEEKKSLGKILKEYKGLFYQEGTNLTNVKDVFHEIVTTDEKPIFSKIYRFPQVHEEEVKLQINKMLEQNIIQESTSPYNSPIWVVPKKMDNSGKAKWRIVIDYRKLNEKTIDDKMPIPNIESILDKLGRANYFSTLDLAKGFHQILVKPEDRAKTAFSTNTGHYEFVRMPFGLKNAPATFQRMINHVLKDYINKICIVYLDDILIFSTSLQEHIDSMGKIFDRLKEYNLKIQPDKCSFLQKDTEYLGHILTKDGIKPNPQKVEKIKNIKIPETQKQIKSFLGITGYYRKFIPNYAKIAIPLTTCLKKDQKININDIKYIKSFEKLKAVLISDPILKYPDFKKQFTLTTDASNFAIGAVLSQNSHPIAYASRTLNNSETNYATIEKELLAIVWATKYFRPYLFGVKFKIKTDHKPLVWLNNLKEPNQKLIRWKIKLNEFDYEIEYLQGKENKVADFLSRLKYDEINHIDENDDATMATVHTSREERNEHIFINDTCVNKYKTQIILQDSPSTELEIHFNKKRVFISRNILNNPEDLSNILRRYIFKGVIAIYSELEDREYNKLQNKLIELFSHNTRLKFYKTTKFLKDVSNLEDLHKIIDKKHQETNHRGIIENYEELKNEVYNPSLFKEIEKTINNCETCNRCKYDRNPIKMEYQLSETPKNINEVIHIDTFHIKHHYFLTSIDKMTKYAHISELEDKTMVTVKEKLQERMANLGKPNKIIADNEFNNIEIKNFCRENNIQIHFTKPNTHTGNSDVERFHSSLLEHFRILSVTQKENAFKVNLYKAVEKYNSTIHSTLKEKPYNIQFNMNPEQRLAISQKNLEIKQKRLKYFNKNRENINYNHERAFIKNYETHRHKHLPKFRSVPIDQKENKLFYRNREISKNNLKRPTKFFLGPPEQEKEFSKRRGNTRKVNYSVNNNNSSSSTRNTRNVSSTRNQ